VRALLADMARRPQPVLYFNPNERFAAAAARALGVARPALDALVRDARAALRRGRADAVAGAAP
jgi:hypothetical protein